MMLHAKCRPSRITQKKREKDESVHSNLRQYGCETRYLDVIVSDFSNSVWRQDIKFDSIITDRKFQFVLLKSVCITLKVQLLTAFVKLQRKSKQNSRPALIALTKCRTIRLLHIILFKIFIRTC